MRERNGECDKAGCEQLRYLGRPFGDVIFFWNGFLLLAEVDSNDKRKLIEVKRESEIAHSHSQSHSFPFLNKSLSLFIFVNYLYFSFNLYLSHSFFSLFVSLSIYLSFSLSLSLFFFRLLHLIIYLNIFELFPCHYTHFCRSIPTNRFNDRISFLNSFFLVFARLYYLGVKRLAILWPTFVNYLLK